VVIHQNRGKGFHWEKCFSTGTTNTQKWIIDVFSSATGAKMGFMLPRTP